MTAPFPRNLPRPAVSLALPFLLALLFAFPIRAQMHALDHSVQDSLAAKAVADSIRAKSDSAKAANDTSGSADDTVNYSAERIRYRSDRFSLSDKALLTYRGSSLVADSIIFYSQDNVVEAMGSPLIQDPANPPILGYKMRYNLKTKVGEIYYGSSKKGNQTFNGVEIRRQKDGEILIARGDFSTCDLIDKHYYFYSRRMILEPKSKVLSGPIVMNVGDVPVAILPMMVLPLGTGRRSGLLQPKFGGDQSLGFYLTGLGYYWAINDYTDFLASGDVIEGQQGTFDQTNLNGQFRYNKRYEYSGSLGGKYYMKEFDIIHPGWMVDYAHDQNITPDQKQTLKGTGRFQSDPTIVDRNALDEAEKSKQTANATLGYRRQFDWNQATFNADFSQENNLTDNLLDRTIPNLGFRVSGPLFPKADEDLPLQTGDDPWYRKLTYNYDNRFNVNMVSRPAISSTGGGDTNTYVGYQDHLSFSGKYPLLQYFNVTPSVNLSQMWSLTSKGDSADPVHYAWNPSAGDLGEYFAFFNTGAALDTRIYGIAQAQDKPWFGKLQAIRHTLIPTVNFTYAPKLDSNPRFLPNPKIGGTAFQEEQKTVGFTLGNDVDLKLAPDNAALPAASGTVPGTAAAVPGSAAAGSAAKKGTSYKLLSATSSINYNFAKDTREWSDIPSVFSIYLTKDVAFTLNTRHSLYDDFAPAAEKDRLTSPILTAYGFGWRKGIQVGGNFNSGVRVKDTQGFPTDRFDTTPWSGDVNYSFDYASTRVGGDANSSLERIFGANGTFQRTLTHSANGSLKLNPTPGWQMSYDTEYNFSEGKFSRHSFAFHRTLHCWQMDFNWTPQGIAEGWNFNIRITDLPDVKLQTSDTRTKRLGQ